METILATALTHTGRNWSSSMSTSMETQEKAVEQGEGLKTKNYLTEYCLNFQLRHMQPSNWLDGCCCSLY